MATDYERVADATGLSPSVEPQSVSPADAASIPRAEHPLVSLLLWLAVGVVAALAWSILP